MTNNGQRFIDAMRPAFVPWTALKRVGWAETQQAPTSLTISCEAVTADSCGRKPAESEQKMTGSREAATEDGGMSAFAASRLCALIHPYLRADARSYPLLSLRDGENPDHKKAGTQQPQHSRMMLGLDPAYVGLARHPRHRRTAFTLIELVAVIVIVALMSGVVVYSVRGHVDAAALEGAVQRFQSLDHRLRSETKRFEQPAEIQVGRQGADVAIRTNIDLAEVGIRRSTSMGSRVAIESILNGRRATASRSVVFNSAGRSANYAAKFVTESEAETWLVVLGVSGQQIRCQSEEEVYAFLRP